MAFIYRILVAMLLVGLMFGCKTTQNNKANRIDISSFYFPIEDLYEKQVYEYQDVNGVLPPYYWVFETRKDKDGQVRFYGENYNARFEVEQKSREQILKDGSVMEYFEIWQRTSRGMIKMTETTLEEKTVYPYSVQDSGGVFLFKVTWNDPIVKGLTNTMVRNRYFNGFKKYNLNGEELECIELLTKEKISFDQKDGEYREYLVSGIELYAKGKGLIYNHKVVGKDQKMVYSLHRTMTWQEFQDHIGQVQDPRNR